MLFSSFIFRPFSSLDWCVVVHIQYCIASYAMIFAEGTKNQTLFPKTSIKICWQLFICTKITIFFVSFYGSVDYSFTAMSIIISKSVFCWHSAVSIIFLLCIIWSKIFSCGSFHKEIKNVISCCWIRLKVIYGFSVMSDILICLVVGFRCGWSSKSYVQGEILI